MWRTYNTASITICTMTNPPIWIMPAHEGWAVLRPIVSQGKVQGTFPYPVIAWQMSAEGVAGYITASRVFPAGSPLWTPDGTVEQNNDELDDEWEDIDIYEAWLRRTLLH